jgi:hypothetical protein
VGSAIPWRARSPLISGRSLEKAVTNHKFSEG